MERKSNNKVIRLRFLVFKKDNKLEAICIDTNIANRANNMELLKQKLIDSSLLYLRSFTKEEIENKLFIRKAPLKYRLRWYFHILDFSPNRRQTSNTAEFDPSSGKLSFA